MHKHRVEAHSPSQQLPFSARSVSLVRSTLPRLGLLQATCGLSPKVSSSWTSTPDL